MSTLVETPTTSDSEPIEAENRLLLSNITWSTYQALLDDLANQSSVRLTYDQGHLEIMSPLLKHERLNRIIAQIVMILAEEQAIDLCALGSTTFKRPDLARGFEPDSCFYIQHEQQVSGKELIDLTVDPPPDLVLEIDITSPSLAKLPIYAQVGVPEVWQHNGKTLIIYQLINANYQQSPRSLALPLATTEMLNHFISQSQTLKSTQFAQTLREWIRKQLTP